MREIGASHGEKTSAQIAINWTICKGTFPIPGAKNLKQTQDNLASTGWRLTEDEIERLDEVSAEVAGK